MIVNLALQLVYGDGLPKPLKILICSKTNASINDLCRKLIRIRDDTAGKFFDRCGGWMCADCTKKCSVTASTKIKLVRFGYLEYMDQTVQQVSVQHLKEMERLSPQLGSSGYDDLVEQVGQLS